MSEQLALGVDIPTDGEVRRDNYVYGFCRSLHGMGFEKDQLTEQNIRQQYVCLCPSVVGKLSAKGDRPSVVEEWRAAQALCPGTPIKITIPGPMTICDTVAVEKAIADCIYADREAICADLVPILRREVFALADAGCKHIQIDEPVFARCVEDTLRYGIENLNDILRGLPADIVRSVHLCCGYPNHLDHVGYVHAPKENYLQLAPLLDESEAHWISLEDAHCRNDLSRLLPLFRKKTVMLGSITVHRSRIESVEEIQGRLEEALRYIDVARLVLAPDCGLGFLPEKIRLAKMRNLRRARDNIAKNLNGGKYIVAHM